MLVAIPQCQGLYKCMQTESRDNTHRHPARQMMLMAMLNTHGNHVQGNLNEESNQHQRTNEQRRGATVTNVVVQLWQQVQERQTQEKRTGERVDQPDMLGCIQSEQKDRDCTENYAGEQYEIIHRRTRASYAPVRRSAPLRIIRNTPAHKTPPQLRGGVQILLH